MPGADDVPESAGALTDLDEMLRTISVVRRRGTYTFVHAGEGDTLAAVPPELLASAAALVLEDEGITAIVPVSTAVATGATLDFVGAWLTLEVHSSLHAVGLTAAVAAALADQDIPCNVVAGARHDHLLVPDGLAQDAIDAIERLRDRG